MHYSLQYGLIKAPQFLKIPKLKKQKTTLKGLRAKWKPFRIACWVLLYHACYILQRNDECCITVFDVVIFKRFEKERATMKIEISFWNDEIGIFHVPAKALLLVGLVWWWFMRSPSSKAIMIHNKLKGPKTQVEITWFGPSLTQGVA